MGNVWEEQAMLPNVWKSYGNTVPVALPYQSSISFAFPLLWN